METMEAKLPVELLSKLRELKEILATQGVIQHRGADRGQSFRLRYRINEDGRSVQRSVELGDEKVAADVQTLLDEWRARKPKPSSGKTVKRTLLTEERDDQMNKRYFRDQAKAAGGGRSFQTKVSQMYDAGMYGSDRDAIRFLFNESYLTPPTRGRPRKSRLW